MSLSVIQWLSVSGKALHFVLTAHKLCRHTHSHTHAGSGLSTPDWRWTGIDRTLRWWMNPLPRKVRDGAISYWAPRSVRVVELANKYTVIVITWQLGHEPLWPHHDVLWWKIYGKRYIALLKCPCVFIYHKLYLFIYKIKCRYTHTHTQ